MITGYKSEIQENGEILVTADGGLRQLLPATEKPYIIIYIKSNKTFHIVKSIENVGDDFTIQEIIQ